MTRDASVHWIEIESSRVPNEPARHSKSANPNKVFAVFAKHECNYLSCILHRHGKIRRGSRTTNIN